jgi:hypothetical protein
VVAGSGGVEVVGSDGLGFQGAGCYGLEVL